MVLSSPKEDLWQGPVLQGGIHSLLSGIALSNQKSPLGELQELGPEV